MQNIEIDGKQYDVYRYGLVHYTYVEGQSIGNLQLVRLVENEKLTDYALLDTDSGVLLREKYEQLKVSSKMKEPVFRGKNKVLKNVVIDATGRNITNEKFIDYTENEYDKTSAGIGYDITKYEHFDLGNVKVKILPLLDKSGNRINIVKSKKALVPVEVEIAGEIISAYIRVETISKITQLEFIHLVEGFARDKYDNDNNVAVGRLINVMTGNITKHKVEEFHRPHSRKVKGYIPVKLTNPQFDTTIRDIQGVVTLPYCSLRNYNSTGAYVSEDCNYLKSLKTGKLFSCEDCAPFDAGYGVLYKECSFMFIDEKGRYFGEYQIRETDTMLTKYESVQCVRDPLTHNAKENVDQREKFVLHRPEHLSMQHVAREYFELIKAGFVKVVRQEGNFYFQSVGSSELIILDKVETKKINPHSV